VNTDVVLRALEVWNSKPEITEEAFAEFAAPGMVVDLSGNVFNPAVYEGFEGFKTFAASVGEAWAEFRMEPEEAFEQGELVVVLVRAVGKGRESGVEIASDVAIVCEVRDGLVASLRVEPDRDAARQLVGR
jgi:ketosteroid isomerase-like protein